MNNTFQIDPLESMAIGRALASQSHELKNVLAIIGEAAGLMDDLFSIYFNSQHNGAVPKELAARLNKALTSITTQVERGHRLTRDLNMLAHMPDLRMERPLPEVNLGIVAALACRMLERNATRAHVQLVPPHALNATAPADAIQCLAACLTLLEWLYQTRQPGEQVVVRAVDGASAIEIDDVPSLDTMPDAIRRIAAASGLRFENENNRLRVTLTGV